MTLDRPGPAPAVGQGVIDKHHGARREAAAEARDAGHGDSLAARRLDLSARRGANDEVRGNHRDLSPGQGAFHFARGVDRETGLEPEARAAALGTVQAGRAARGGGQ